MAEAFHHLPVSIDGCSLSLIEPVSITSIAPFRGQHDAVGRYLEKQVGLGLPEPGRMIASDTGAVIWVQLGQWWVMGPVVAPPGAAVTDQSDGWVGVALRGPLVADLMDRVSTLNSRAMAVGDVARADLEHRMGLIIKRADGVDLWVMRTLARDFQKHLAGHLTRIAAISSRSFG